MISTLPDRERRIELLRLYAGDLERARDAERWIVWGEITPTHEMGAEPATESDVVPGEDARAVCLPPLPDAECGVSRAGTIPTREGESCGPGSHSGFGVVPELSVNLNIETLPAPPQPDACSTGDAFDPNPIPSFLRRVVVAPASPAQLDEREGAAT